MEPLIFVHVPKTAGTSLRVSLAEHFNDEEMLWDYGADSKDTSPLIMQCMHKEKDPYKILASQPKAIYGHSPVKRYLNLSSTNNVITFLRDPVERVWSEFKHFKRVDNFTGSLEEFVNTKRFINSQQAFLVGMPWPAIGFIGISERYKESLELLGKKLGLNLTEKKLNRAPIYNRKGPDEEQIELIKSKNQIDIQIYQQALEQFDWRCKLASMDTPFTIGGWGLNKERGTLFGFAFHESNDVPVDIKVLVDGEEKAQVNAIQYHAAMHKYRAPRRGYVGFSCSLKGIPASSVRVVNATTGQPLASFN